MRWILVVAPLVGLLAVAAAVATVAMLARRRQAAGVAPEWAWRSALAEVGIVLGTVPPMVLILAPVGHGRTLHLVPLRELIGLLSGDLVFALIQIGGNLLVFSAFGALAPIRWRIGLPSILTIACLASASLETLQYVMDTGRYTSVDDVLLNTTGAGLAALVSRRWWRVSAPAGQSGDRDRRPGRRTPR